MAAAKVHHIVLLKMKRLDKVGPLFAALERLNGPIGGIESFQAGPYASPEGLNQGYTHGFLMTFTDAAARDAYLVHPEHEQVKNEFLPFVEGVVAFDFEVPA